MLERNDPAPSLTCGRCTPEPEAAPTTSTRPTPLNLSTEPANGTWKLRTQDAAAADIGRIDSWTISL
jgi:subtilisin-like proprotein convertase family protein